jgi:hypothetical protein
MIEAKGTRPEIDWLSGDLPPSPVPRDDSTPIFDEVTQRFAPVWPEQPVDGTVPPMPPAGLVRRVVRRLRLVRWTPGRLVFGGASATVLLVTWAGSWFA